MLRKALEDYISMRETEKMLSGRENMSRFFCVPLGYGCTKKVAAARKMMRELDGDKTVQYTGDDFSCFDNARLAKVLQSHQNEAPSSYVKQKEAFDEQIRQLEREAYREYALGLRGMA